MLYSLIALCREHPQIAIFLTVIIGYFIGKIRIRNFSLGSCLGIFITGLVLGQMKIEISPTVMAIGFSLFLFCIGYQMGPSFFTSFKKDSMKYILLTLVVVITALITVIFLGKILDFDYGTIAGLLSGAMTQTTALGTAESAIQHLSISVAEKTTLEQNATAAYAVTYMFGAIGLILFFKVLPRLMRINLKSEAKKLEKNISKDTLMRDDTTLFSWYKRLNIRAYQVTNLDSIGKTVHEIEGLFPGQMIIDGLKRNGQTIAIQLNTIIQKNDVITLIGIRPLFFSANTLIGYEVDDNDLENITGEMLDVCVLKPDAVGQTLADISNTYGHGCFLRKIIRHAQELSFTKDTIIEKCDVLRIAGSKKDVEKLANYLGYVEHTNTITDLITVGFGCILGTLLGLITIYIAGIPITFGIGGGILIAGLILGWLRTLFPPLGQITSNTQGVLTELGLNLFIACLGLVAGPIGIATFQTTGYILFFTGIVVTLLPTIVGIIFGKFVLKMNPVLLLGALAGASTMTPALDALKDEAESPAPALGYAIPYTLGNILLTICGAVIINVMYKIM